MQNATEYVTQKYMSPSEYAQITGICSATVRKMLKKGLIDGAFRTSTEKGAHWKIPAPIYNNKNEIDKKLKEAEKKIDMLLEALKKSVSINNEGSRK